MKNKINRRNFMKTTSTAAIGSGLLSNLNAQSKKRPNILWIVAEDMNDWMSCYGDKTITTPAFDSMAKDGVRFTRAYVPAPVCSACRSGIITGTMQTTFGIHNHRSSRSNTKDPKLKELGMIPLPKGVKTIPELFQDAGYETFNQGKTDYNFVYSNNDLYSIKNWKEADDKPWFGQIQVKGGKSKPKQNTVSPDKITVPPYYPNIQEFKDIVAKHYDSILKTDSDVKKIMSNLKDDGLLDNTVVIFFSDHGMPDGFRHKQFCYEGGLRVPLIVSNPKPAKNIFKANTVRHDLVSLIDISVSSLVMAGIKVPDYMEGRNIFVPGYKEREFIIGARDRCDYTIEHIRAVVTKKYKYLKNFLTDRPYLQPQYRDGHKALQKWKELYAAGKLNPIEAAFASETRPAEEFYDLDKDPHETKNLVQDTKYKKEFEHHRQILNKWMKETDDKGQYPESTEGLFQVMSRWGKKCVNPEYDAVRKKYGNIEPPPKSKKKKKNKRKKD